MPDCDRSLWTSTAPPRVPDPQLTDDCSADVIVIGAGYTGLSAALHLSESGRDVVVLEAREPGWGASGRNGGQVIAGLKLDPDDIESQLGPTIGARLVKLAGSAPDLVFELIRRYDIKCDAVRPGWLQLAETPAQLRTAVERVEQWRRRGANVRLLSREETASLVGSSHYLGGWLDCRGGLVDPLAYARGLAGAATSLGCRLYAGSPVTCVTQTASGWCVATAGGSARAPRVVLATGAYTDRAFDRLRRTVVTVPSMIIATEPLPAELRATLLSGGHGASEMRQLLRYFRLDAAGRLLMGARGAFGNVPARQAAKHHYAAVRDIFPQLGAVEFAYHWSGNVALTRDHLPHLHEPERGLFTAIGYNGRGVAMATAMGRVLARLAVGAAASEADFPVGTLRPIFMHRFSRPAAQLLIAVHRLVDR